MHLIEQLFSSYGYLVLLIGLFLELIALPIPGEIMMSYCGFLVFQGQLSWGVSIICASIGVISGITISYLIGLKLGNPFFHKYGNYVHLAPERLDRMSIWFNNFGRHVIFLTYYIPGVRHFSGYLAGITGMSFRSFALNAYPGAVVWTAVFISLGRLLGQKWDKFHTYTREFGILGGVILFAIVIAYYSIRSYRKQILEKSVSGLNLLINIFHSMGKIRLVMVTIVIMFLGLVAGMVALLRSFFRSEYVHFDELVQYLVTTGYSKGWHSFMRLFGESTSYLAVTMVCIVCIYLILNRKLDRMLEIKFLFFSVIGAEVFARALQYIFHRAAPVGGADFEFIRHSVNTYPSAEMMTVIAAYGFMSFLVIRHQEKLHIRLATILVFITVAFFSGQSILYFDAQYPSDVLAGYVFGGIWLCINLIAMEINRILPKLTTNKYI